MSKAKFHGIGEAIFDIIFKGEGDEQQFIRGSGGGSIGNFLANCSFHGFETWFHGTQGGSIHGEIAMADLERVGVQIGNRQPSSAADSRIIFQTIKPARVDDLFSTTKHRFSLRCPVCKVKPEEASLPKLDSQFFISLPNFSKWDVLFFDKITSERAKLSRKHIGSGGLALLDLGHIGALRYRKPEELIWQLNSFNIIHTSESIIRSLSKRVGSASADSLFRHLEDHLVISSDGENGLRILRVKDGVCQAQISVPAPLIEDFVDDAGAGDTLFSVFICSLFEATSGVPRNILRCGPAKWKSAVDRALLRVVDVIGCEGARCHIPLSRRLPESPGILVDKEGVLVSRIIRDSGKVPDCVFCRRSFESTKLKVRRGSRAESSLFTKNVNTLLGEIRQGFAPAAELAAGKVVPNQGSCIVVGTGGSYPVACFIATLINDLTEAIAIPLFPLEYIRLQKRSDSLIVISYSGKTGDCRSVIECAKESGVKHIHLVTQSESPILERSLRGKAVDSVVSYGDSAKRERGFVSIKGTVLPCALFLRAVASGSECLVDLFVAIGKHFARSDDRNFPHLLTGFLERSLSVIKSGGSFELFGTGACFPAMKDFESKFTEGGLNVVRIHESKDFSHGRFMSFSHKQVEKMVAIVFIIGEGSTYEHRLIRSLRLKNIPLLEIRSETTGLFGSFELLFLVQFVVKFFAGALRIDISKPKSIPKWGLDLYNWEEIR